MTDNSFHSNPYKAPTHLQRESDSSLDVGQTVSDDLSSECRGNLTLTSKIIKFASVVFGLGSLVSILQIWSAFRLYGFPNGWTWWHTFISYRIVYTPCWLLLAWMLWKYAKSLDKMSINGVIEAEAAMEQQAKAWLAVGLLLFVILLGLAIRFSGALTIGIP